MANESKNTENEAPRAPLKAELRVYYGPSLEKVLYSFTVDMSSGGLFLNTENLFSVNETVMLSFTLPDVKKVINCRARVAWVNSKGDLKKNNLPAGVGLQFLDLSAEYSQSIQSLLKHGGVVAMNETSEEGP